MFATPTAAKAPAAPVQTESDRDSSRSDEHPALGLRRKDDVPNVRAIYRASPPGGRPRPRGGSNPQAQLHRHGAHPPRPAARGGGAGREEDSASGASLETT